MNPIVSNAERKPGPEKLRESKQSAFNSFGAQPDVAALSNILCCKAISEIEAKDFDVARGIWFTQFFLQPVLQLSHQDLPFHGLNGAGRVAQAQGGNFKIVLGLTTAAPLGQEGSK